MALAHQVLAAGLEALEGVEAGVHLGQNLTVAGDQGLSTYGISAAYFNIYSAKKNKVPVTVL